MRNKIMFQMKKIFKKLIKKNKKIKNNKFQRFKLNKKI